MTGAGAMRRCSLPACPAWYDAIEVMGGRATAKGWRQWRLDMRLCPDHSWLWVPVGGGLAPHLPALVRDGGTVWVRCSCGWVLDTSGLTAGESAGRYVGHLPGGALSASVRAEPTSPEGKGHPGGSTGH